MIELILLYFGIRALLSGHFSVGGREATGPAARLAGFIWTLPIPVTALLLLWDRQELEAHEILSDYWIQGYFWVQLALLLGCGSLGCMVAGISVTCRGYEGGEMRHGTDSRADILLPQRQGRSRSAGRKGDLKKAVKGEVPVRRRKRSSRVEDSGEFEFRG